MIIAMVYSSVARTDSVFLPPATTTVAARMDSFVVQLISVFQSSEPAKTIKAVGLASPVVLLESACLFLETVKVTDSARMASSVDLPTSVSQAALCVSLMQTAALDISVALRVYVYPRISLAEMIAPALLARPAVLWGSALPFLVSPATQTPIARLDTPAAKVRNAS
jgi:hypothetical protein